MNQHFAYFLILFFSIAGPLALSFDRKVRFYKKWRFLLPATLLPALLYILWDIYFVSKEVWSFNDKYITGIKLFNLPIEEVTFFLIIPYCSIFIYECTCIYFTNCKNKKAGDTFLKVLAIVLMIAGIIFYDKYYTSWTFVFNSVFIGIIYCFRSYFKEFDAGSFVVAYLFTLIPFLIVNGLLTALPVVIYNNNENTGIRIYSIPFEDVFYGMLLVLFNIVIYEKLKYKNIA